MSRLVITPEQWEEARTLYEVDGWDAQTIAEYYGVSLQTIYTRTRTWTKPSRNETLAEARERRRLIQDKATKEVETEVANKVAIKLDQLVGQVREDAIVEANAQELGRVMMLHRTGATRLRETLAALFSELQLASLPQSDLEHLVTLVAEARSEDETDGRTRNRIKRETVEAFSNLLGLDSRADIAKKLVDSMIKAVDLERRVYGIRDEVSESDIAKALKELSDAG